MAKVFFNKALDFSREQVWYAQNGAKRRTLIIVNKLGNVGENVTNINADVGVFEKGNHSFIFLNPETERTKGRTLGIFLNNSCGYRLKTGESRFVASSVGGYGNSESKFGVYEVGAVIAVHSYKNRQGDTYYKLLASGWVEMGSDVPIEECGDKITVI